MTWITIQNTENGRTRSYDRGTPLVTGDDVEPENARGPSKIYVCTSFYDVRDKDSKNNKPITERFSQKIPRSPKMV